ncbi:hypothetical protein T492DRAFT_474770 [Pavlovales sp. CCMP2436]|nr:hypothetical protein T492DRAFT_474770 [Pavlovales sp. CCMP2436]
MAIPCAVAACAIAAIAFVLIERRLARAPARAAGLEIVRAIAEAEMWTRSDSEGSRVPPNAQEMSAEFELHDGSFGTSPPSLVPARKLTCWRCKGSRPAVSPRWRAPGQGGHVSLATAGYYRLSIRSLRGQLHPRPVQTVYSLPR